MAKKEWQHVIPQREPWNCDPITPSWDSDRGTLPSHYVCAHCGKDIRTVDENEGPESLKALFRF